MHFKKLKFVRFSNPRDIAGSEHSSQKKNGTAAAVPQSQSTRIIVPFLKSTSISSLPWTVMFSTNVSHKPSSNSASNGDFFTGFLVCRFAFFVPLGQLIVPFLIFRLVLRHRCVFSNSVMCHLRYYLHLARKPILLLFQFICRAKGFLHEFDIGKDFISVIKKLIECFDENGFDFFLRQMWCVGLQYMCYKNK